MRIGNRDRSTCALRSSIRTEFQAGGIGVTRISVRGARLALSTGKIERYARACA